MSDEATPDRTRLALAEELNNGSLTGTQRETLDRVSMAYWRTTTLVLGVPADEEVAAAAIELGALCGIGFGNIYGLVCHPAHDVVRYANETKGRPDEQVGSIVTVTSTSRN